jgi:hypothetical protein
MSSTSNVSQTVEKVVQLLERADVEPPFALLELGLLQVVDDLALSGGRPSDQDDGIEGVPHGPPALA